jgi:hypothetical protein
MDGPTDRGALRGETIGRAWHRPVAQVVKGTKGAPKEGRGMHGGTGQGRALPRGAVARVRPMRTGTSARAKLRNPKMTAETLAVDSGLLNDGHSPVVSAEHKGKCTDKRQK